MGIGYFGQLANQELGQITEDIKELRKRGIELISVPAEVIRNAKTLPELVEVYMSAIEESLKAYKHTE